MNSKKQHGGKRIGAGNKGKYNEPTITMRIPMSKVNAVLRMINSNIEPNKAQEQPIECGCILLGYTSNGVGIWNKCNKHRDKTKSSKGGG